MEFKGIDIYTESLYLVEVFNINKSTIICKTTIAHPPYL